MSIFSRKSFIQLASIFTAGLITSSSLASADEQSAKLFRDLAYSGKIEEGISSFSKLADDPDNGEAVFALGAFYFLDAIKGLQLDLYRYGVQAPGGRMPFLGLPIFRVPVPENPEPELLTYEKSRAILEKFTNTLQLAEKQLAKLGKTQAKLPIDPLQIGFDIDGNGKISESETLGSTLINNRITLPDAVQEPPHELQITFDTADASWLRGYSNVLMSISKFFLSHDYSSTYENSFHLLFGFHATSFGKALLATRGDESEIAVLKQQIAELEVQKESIFSEAERKEYNAIRSQYSKLKSKNRAAKNNNEILSDEEIEELASLEKKWKKLQEKSKNSFSIVREISKLNKRLVLLDPTAKGSERNSSTSIIDLISFIHTLNWPVIDREKFEEVRTHMLAMAKLNKATWELVRMESDNDHEWLPNANQKGPFQTLTVSDEQIDGWLETMGKLEDILNGDLLLPSMRFGKGVNLKAYFDKAENFDPVMFITGPGSIAYAEKGPIADQGLFRTLSSPFGRNFGAYALWFN